MGGVAPGVGGWCCIWCLMPSLHRCHQPDRSGRSASPGEQTGTRLWWVGTTGDDGGLSGAGGEDKRDKGLGEGGVLGGGRAALCQGKVVSGKLGGCRASLGQPLHKPLELRDTFCCGGTSLPMQGGGLGLL